MAYSEPQDTLKRRQAAALAAADGDSDSEGDYCNPEEDLKQRLERQHDELTGQTFVSSSRTTNSSDGSDYDYAHFAALPPQRPQPPRGDDDPLYDQPQTSSLSAKLKKGLRQLPADGAASARVVDSDENDYAHLLTAPKRAAGPHGSQPARGAAADAAAAERSYINVTKEGVPIRDYVNLQDSIGKAAAPS